MSSKALKKTTTTTTSKGSYDDYHPCRFATNAAAEAKKAEFFVVSTKQKLIGPKFASLG